jgi:preprotein translocase subunit SecF
MEFFKPGVTYDFFKYRTPFVITSMTLTLLSVVALFYPGPRLGIDFKGGTEIELAFESQVSAAELRSMVGTLGFGQPEVISVQGKENHYILRLEQVSSLPPSEVEKAKGKLNASLGTAKVEELRASPGGDKLSIRLTESATPDAIRDALTETGLKVRDVTHFGNAADFRYEAQLVGVGDKLMQGLKEKLGDKAPEKALRVEWVGPKAGEQLRDAAIKSMLYAVAFIMVYVALRFDLRFAPGGIIALAHDTLITLGVYVVFQKEVTLGTIAALLTIIGFSINDTIVIYDRIRENMARMRTATLAQVINVSTSQTLSRTVITSGVALISIGGFFFWGTPLVKDIVFALTVGFLIGVYSSVYVAAPLTEWMDRRFFRKA